MFYVLGIFDEIHIERYSWSGGSCVWGRRHQQRPDWRTAGTGDETGRQVGNMGQFTPGSRRMTQRKETYGEIKIPVLKCGSQNMIHLFLGGGVSSVT